MGAGHTITAIYEIIPIGVKSDFIKETDNLKYQKKQINQDISTEVATIKTRYKKPDGHKSIEFNIPVLNNPMELKNTSDNYRFASSVAMFGMLLRNSEYKGSSDYNQVIKIAENAKGKDDEGYKTEFLRLVKIANQQKL